MSSVDVHGLPAKWREPTPIDDQTLYTMGRRNQRKQCADELEAALRQSDEALADTQRAIIEAAERRGYERGKQDALRQSGEAVAYGVKRKSDGAIVGIVLAKVHKKPASLAEYNDAYDEVPLYTAPPATSGLVEALHLAQRMNREALPKFNWGASALDANAIDLLNRAPMAVNAALTRAQELT